MIVRTRIGKFLGLPWLRIYSPFITEKMKSTLSQSAQKAVWANTVINTIWTAKGSDSIDAPSLREQIINLKHPADGIIDPVFKKKILSLKNPKNEELTFDDEIRDDFLRMLFIMGLELSKIVFKQDRIVLANEPETTATPRMFIFCPNLLVTQHMFNLLRTYITDILVYGGYGISKTIALVLFHHLSSIINKCVYQSHQNETLKSELKFLKANRLITDIPKLFYWSLNLSDTQVNIKNLIIAQATQLSESEREELKKITDYKDIIKILQKKYGEREITVQTIIDQINILASILRKNNFYINSKKNPQYQQKKKDTIEKQRKEGINLKENMKQFQKLGISTFYNSSMRIEQSLLQKPESGKQTLDIQKTHQRITKKQVPYFKNLEQTWGCHDYSHFFWFQIEKKLKQRNIITSENLVKLRKQFNSHVQSKRWSKYLRFVNIRNMWKNKAMQLQSIFQNIQIGQKYSESVVLFTQLLKQSSIQDFKQNLNKFIKDDDSLDVRTQKINLLSIFYNLASQSESKDDTFVIQISASSKQLQKQYIIKYLSSDMANKQMFSLQFKDYTTKIIFFWTPQEFMENTKDYLFPYVIGNPNIDPNLAKIIKQSATAHASLIEGTLIDVLEIQNTVAIFKYKPTKEGEGSLFSMYFDKKGRTTFTSFKGQKNKSIPDNMRDLLVMAHKNPGQYIFASPVTKDGQTHAVNSPSIDYAYMRYNPNAKIFELFTFDVTISKSKNQIQKNKPKDFVNLFNELIKNLKSFELKKSESQQAIIQFAKDKNIRILHTILCSENVDPIYQMKEEKEQKKEEKLKEEKKKEENKEEGGIICEIRTSNLYDLTLYNSDPNSLEYVNALKNYIGQKKMLEEKNIS